MAITDLDSLVAAMASSRYLPSFQLNSMAAQATSAESSHWRNSGNYPVIGAIPTSAELCDAATVRAFPLAPRSGDQDRVLVGIDVYNANFANHVLYIEDRLAHMGGLVGNVTTAQTVGIDLHANLASSNLEERIGSADFSSVEWFLEWYSGTGTTATTPTLGVTFHDGTTGTAGIWNFGSAALPGTVSSGRRYRIAPTNGKFIRSVETVTLSASTGTAGNFGVTALVHLASARVPNVGVEFAYDWSSTKLVKIADNACLTFGQLNAGTSTGGWGGRLIQAVG